MTTQFTPRAAQVRDKYLECCRAAHDFMGAYDTSLAYEFQQAVLQLVRSYSADSNNDFLGNILPNRDQTALEFRFHIRPDVNVWYDVAYPLTTEDCLRLDHTTQPLGS